MTNLSNDRVEIEWIRDLPKVELHTHMESIGEEYTRVLAERAGVPAPELTEPRGLDALLRYLDEVGALVKTVEDAEEMAYRIAARASESGALYIEVILNTTHWWANWGDRLEDFFTSLDKGFSRAEEQGLAKARLSVSLLRTQSQDEAMSLVNFLIEKRPPRVVALSADGNETGAGCTGERFAPAFDLAAKSGLRITVHTGESGGPIHMRDSLEYLNVERIDHGFRCFEDPELVALIAEKGIALNICPSQNLAMGWMDRLEDHPMDKIRKAGVAITINTDSSWKFVLANEYKLAADTFGWDKNVLRELAANSIEACFAPEDEKQTMREKLAGYPD